MSPDIVDLDHVAFRVTDLDEALAFYHDLLGMPIRDRDRYAAGDVPYVAVAAGGRHLHLVPIDESSIDEVQKNETVADDEGDDHGDDEGDDHGDDEDDDHGDDEGDDPGDGADRVPVGGDHLCLLIRSDGMDGRDQLRELLEEIEAAGYDVEPDEPRKRYGAYGRAWAAYVRDPDGRRVELKIH